MLDKVLRERGYEPEAILGGWKERGCLETEEGYRYTTKRCRMPGNKGRPRLVVIRRKAFEEADAC